MPGQLRPTFHSGGSAALLPLSGVRRLSAARSRRRCICRASLQEHSQLVVQELLLFMFQQDYDTQLQRALNNEAYDLANDIRQRRQSVDEAMDKLKVFKSGDQEFEGEAMMSVEDYPSQEVALRVQLQRAVEEERYEEAALLRDSLQQLQQRYQDAAAKSGASPADSSEQRCFYIGQRVQHIDKGYRGVVYGWDNECCENEKWKTSADVSSLERGQEQMFYHVLVDSRDWPADSADVPVAYVAHEKLYAPKWPSTWMTEKGPEEFRSPMKSILFLGDDENGDLIPTKALRERLKQARRDVFPPPSSDDS